MGAATDRKVDSTAYPMPFLMTDEADHITGKTGLSPTVVIRKQGGAFGVPSGAVSEIANGWYELAGHADDRGTLGTLLLHATAVGADPVDREFGIVNYDPFDIVSAINGNPGKTNQEVYDNERGTDGAYTGTPPTAEAIADQVHDEPRAEHTVAGSFGEKNQLGVPSETLADYKADVGSLALESTVEDRPTLVEIEASSVLAKEASVTAIAGDVETVASDVLWLKKFEQSNASLTAEGIQTHTDHDIGTELGKFEMRNRAGELTDTDIVQRTWRE